MQDITVFLVSQAIIIIGGLMGIYIKVSLKLKELDIRVNMVERQEDKVVQKLDSIIDTITTLLVKLEQKQDR
jgi:hypothetical protein